MTRQSIQTYCEVPTDWPVIEMEKPFLIMVNQRDTKGAVRDDCRQCVFAKAATRFAAGGAAAFMSEVAYLPLRDAKGRGYIGKFSLPHAMREAIRDFDATGLFPADRSFELAPLYASKRATARRVEAQLRRQVRADKPAAARGPNKPLTGRRAHAPQLISAPRLLP